VAGHFSSVIVLSLSRTLREASCATWHQNIKVANDTAASEPSRARGFGTSHAVTSPAQDGLWFLSKLVPDSPAYNVCRQYRITGDLDIEAMRVAWRTVVDRHEILRTVFTETDGRPAPRVAADGTVTLSFVDITEVSAPDPEERSARLCTAAAATPFRLADEPLTRLVLVRLGPTEYRLLLVMHLLIADDRSMSIVVDELADGYAAAVHGCAALPVLRSGYADFAERQREWVTADDHRRLLDWWTATLTPVPAALTLPTDRVRPARPAFHGGAVPFEWDLGRSLSERAGVAGATPFAVLLAAFQALLHRYSEQDRVAVGVPVTVRPSPAADDLVGPFHNLLVLAADFSAGPTFRELLGRVAGSATDAFDRRELPFTDLVRALNVERDVRRIPLCDAMLVFHDEPESGLRLAGATVRREPVHNGAAKADLTLTVDRVDSVVAGSLEYRGSLFDRATAGLVLDQLRTLLRAALDDPELPVDALPLDDADRVLATERAADRIAEGTTERPANELVHSHAERTPETAAVVWDGHTVSYGDLAARARSIASALRGAGEVAGAAVAVRVSPGPDQVAALLGVLDRGAHVVWFGTGDAGERGRAVFSDLRPTCLVLDREPDGDDFAEWYRAELGGRIVTIPSANHDSAAPKAAVELGDRAYVAYTSGSTGKPKGIPQTHGALAQFVTWMAAALRMAPGSRVAQWVAPEHDPAICELFATLVAGATLYPVPERVRIHPEKLVDWLAENQITHIQTVPSFARELLRVITSGNPLDSLTHIVLMGEALSDDLANGFRAAVPSARLINLYGPTETVAGTWCEITGSVHGTAPIGQSIPGRQILLLDDHDRPCPVGVTGEIVIRSPYVTPGYIGTENRNGPAFRPLPDLEAAGVPSYRTGDLGRWRWDGLLEFRGRKDFQVKLLGNRVELSDIEAALDAHETVVESAVVAVTNQDGLVNRLVVYVVPAGDGTGSAGIWRAHLRRRFGGKLMLPASFTVLDDRLPRNLAGKVDRRRLPDPGPPQDGDARTPETETEKLMAELWTELLDIEQVSAEDTFFSAGGHSLLLPQLAKRIYDRFGVELPLPEYFANPSLAGLSALVESASACEGSLTATV
jgi:amino acid adenylation domain-containing protein